MKRFLALMLALCTLCHAAVLAEEPLPETAVTREGEACGVTILRNHRETDTATQRTALDYPTFECSDEAFAQFLTQNITEPICRMGQMDAGQARGGYCASLDFEGVLSVEASVSRLPEGAK